MSAVRHSCKVGLGLEAIPQNLKPERHPSIECFLGISQKIDRFDTIAVSFISQCTVLTGLETLSSLTCPFPTCSG